MGSLRVRLARVLHRDQWRWLEPVRANPRLYHFYRMTIGAIGFAIVGIGLVLVPLPGPGWLIVFIGVSVLASEFHWAKRLHEWGWAKVQAWTRWIGAQPLWVRAAVGTATCAFVCAVVWCVFKVGGLPGFLPHKATAILQQYLLL